MALYPAPQGGLDSSTKLTGHAATTEKRGEVQKMHIKLLPTSFNILYLPPTPTPISNTHFMYFLASEGHLWPFSQGHFLIRLIYQNKKIKKPYSLWYAFCKSFSYSFAGIIPNTPKERLYALIFLCNKHSYN